MASVEGVVDLAVRDSSSDLITPLDPTYTPKTFSVRDNEGLFVNTTAKDFAERVELPGPEVANDRVESRVLVLYTGGTIGMKTHNGVYEPEPNYLPSALASVPHLNDEEYVQQYYGDADPRPFCLPPVKFVDPRILYWIVEYEPLLDSSDMTFDDWIRIAKDIKRCYEKYDGFVVLHGTDTMGYTSSALSFMFEDLGKPVVVTGAQIPLVEVRSDGRDNLVGALVVAGGNYNIPEVTVCFNHKVYRGNRVSKLDNSGLDAFNSPNIPALVEMEIDIKVDHDAIFRAPVTGPFKIHTNMNRTVGLLRIFPSMPISALKAFLAPPMEGVVIQTYGAGNMPSKRLDIIEAIRKATARGLLVVNCSQCIRGQVEVHYATGKVLREAGVLGGSDMTPEAALMKLSYVLGHDDWTLEQKRKAMCENLRGELTKQVHSVSLSQGANPMLQVLPNLIKFFRTGSSLEVEKIKDSILPPLLCSAAEADDIAMLEALKEVGAKMTLGDYDNRTALHVGAESGHMNTVNYLLQQGLNVHSKDRWHQTPMECAIQGRHLHVIKKLKSVGAHITKNKTAIGIELCLLASQGDLVGIEAWLTAGADVNCSDYDERTALHVAASRNKLDVVELLLSKGADKGCRDSFGTTPLAEAQSKGHDNLVEILRK